MKTKFIGLGCAAAVCLALTSCQELFQSKVNMATDTNPANLGDLFEREEEIEELGTSAQLFVSQGLLAGKIQLTWSQVDYATSYRIERAVVSSTNASGGYDVPDESDYNSICDYCYSTSYTDMILSNPSATSDAYKNHYFYKITAQNFAESLEGPATDPTVSATRGEGWLLKSPSNVQADKGKSTDTINISWEPVEEAVEYEIFRGEKSNGTGMESLATVTANQTSYENSLLTSEQGTEFYYKIAAKNSYGNSSALSSIAMGYSLKEGAPAIAGNVRVVDGKATSKSQLVITWDPVAATSATATITYSLYKTSSEDSVYSLVKNKLTGTSYTDSSGLKTGVIYYYYVQAVSYDSATLETTKGAFSESGENSYGYLLSPPDSVEVLDGDSDSTVNLTWTPAVGADEVDFTYTIYSSDTQNGDYTILQSDLSPALGADGQLTAAVEKKNFYKITTNNPLGTDTESVMSAGAAPQPAAPQNVTASKTALLSRDFTANKNNVYPVLISWEKPVSDDPAGYYVYRSTKTDSGFRKLNEEPLVEFEYIDANETAKAGTVYYYKVVSINSLGQGKKGNDPQTDTARTCMGYGALTREQWFREYNKTCKGSQKKLTLMHKTPDTSKLGSETIKGDISGTLSYKAVLVNGGLGGAEITMHYENYADYYIGGDSSMGVYFRLTGNTDTTSNMSANGKMHESVVCTGMYPGTAGYNKLEIKGGAAGGGYYEVTTRDLNSNTVLENGDISWLIGEE